MSDKVNIDEEFAQLEQAVKRLPREIQPGRDLWPEINDRISHSDRGQGRTMHWWNSPILSAASLMIATAAVTFAIVRPGSVPDSVPSAVQEMGAQDVVPGTLNASLDPGFLANRKRLERQLEGRLGELSPEMQRVVQQNLATIRGSLRAMSMALASDPDNADLQDLLLSTYEQELRVMTEINQMPAASPQRIDL